jgi:hypothetical protein
VDQTPNVGQGVRGNKLGGRLTTASYIRKHLLPSTIKMSKNILLPGGIGYIGSHVMLELLLHTEHRLTVIDNYYNSAFINL